MEGRFAPARSAVALVAAIGGDTGSSQPEVYEDLLRLLGCAQLTPARVEHHLAGLARTFDAAFIGSGQDVDHVGGLVEPYPLVFAGHGEAEAPPSGVPVAQPPLVGGHRLVPEVAGAGL